MSTGYFQLGRVRTPAARVRLLALAIALLLTCGAQARGSSDFRERSVIGKWKLVSVLDIASIASLDETDAQALLGKYMTISASGVQVDEEVCSAPEFWAERIKPEPHIQEKLHSSSERLRLPDPAIMVELGCTDVYIRNPRELVLLWGGAMFEAVRIIPKSESKPKSLPNAKRTLGKVESGRAQKAGKPGPAKVVATGRAKARKPRASKSDKAVSRAGAKQPKRLKDRPGA